MIWFWLILSTPVASALGAVVGGVLSLRHRDEIAAARSPPTTTNPWPEPDAMRAVSIWAQRRRLEHEASRQAAAARMRAKFERERALFPHPSRQLLLYAVAVEFGVDAEAMASPRRFKILIEARAAFAVAARQRFASTTTQIGRTLRRDHTTITHALNSLAPRLGADPAFAARLDRVRAAMGPAQPLN